MAGPIVRAAIVGASSMLGKELAAELSSSDTTVWDLTLLDAALVDAGAVGGQLGAAGDEALLIQTLTPGAFAGMDVVFFAGDMLTAKKHWMEARDAGAGIVDLSGGLRDEPGVEVLAPWITAPGRSPGPVIVSAHPAAMMLGLVLARLHSKWSDVHVMATVMEPASQQGSAGVDELHQQVVALLSFQSVPTDVYGSQIAFNLSAAPRNESRANIANVETMVRRDLGNLVGEAVADRLAMQWVQAPVFHGYTASVFVSASSSPRNEEVRAALDGDFLQVLAEDDDTDPNNLTATEQGSLRIAIRQDHAKQTPGFWMWMAVDNLKLTAQNAVACAMQLLSRKRTD